MAGGKVVPAERARSHLSYYVVMAAILGLLALLCCYVCYFFISKIRELSVSELPPAPTTRATRPATTTTPCNKNKEQATYPVRPVIRDTATAMATLCRQLPPGGAPQGDQVFPGARSPAPRPAHASPPLAAAAAAGAGAPEAAAQGKLPPAESCIGFEAPPSVAVEAAS